MAEVVDSIVAELIARDQGYIETFDRATAAHGRFKASVDKLKVQTFDLGAEGQKYKQGVAGMAQAEEQGSARMVRAKKNVSDAAKATAAAEKAAAKAIADAQKAEQASRIATEKASAKAAAAAQKEAEQKAAAAKLAAEAVVAAAAKEEAARARIAAMVERSLARQASSNTRGPGTLFGSQVPREASMVPASVIPAAAGDAAATGEAAAQAEINHLMADQATLQASLTVARGRERDILRDQITEMRLYNSLIRAGYTEEQATEQVEKRMLAIEAERARIAQRQKTAQIGQFAAGSGLGRFGGLNAATAGIAAAAALTAGVAAIGSSLDFAKEIKNTADAVGLTTRQVQIYEAAARQAGVSTDQFRSGIGQLSSYLGRAREGDEQAAKTFAALGINIKNASSAGDLLPTLIDRISSIADPAQRAAVETRLFGEEGRRLDAVLSGGNQRVSELAAALERTGAVLSSADIQRLTEAEAKLAAVKAQLQVDLAQVVANNADAITGLAKSFAALADSIGGALKKVDDFSKSTAIGKFLSNPAGAGQAVRSRIVDGVKQFFGYSTAPSSAEADVPARPTPLGNVQPGKAGDLSKLFAPKRPRGKSANQLAAEADERTRRFNAEIGRLQDEQLSAQNEITSDEQARSANLVQQINNDRKTQLAEAEAQADADKRRGANKELTDARLRLVEQAINDVADAKIEAQAHKDTVSDIQRLAAIRSQQLDQADEALRTEQDQATTAAARARIEKELLANDIERQRISNQSVLDRAKAGDGSITQQELASARGNLRNLPRQQALGNASIDARNLGPLAEYFKNLPHNAEEVNEALQRVAADGLGSISDGLANVISGARSLKDVFHSVAQQIIADLARIAIEKAISFGISEAAGSSNGTIASIGKALSGTRAAGGDVVGGGTYLVGEHGPEMFSPSVSGHVSPNQTLRSAPGGGGGSSGTVEHRIVIEPNAMFDTHVDTRVIGGIVQYAPVIVEGAKSAMFAAARRPGLPRSTG